MPSTIDGYYRAPAIGSARRQPKLPRRSKIALPPALNDAGSRRYRPRARPSHDVSRCPGPLYLYVDLHNDSPIFLGPYLPVASFLYTYNYYTTKVCA